MRHTVAASVALPVVLMGGIVLGSGLPGAHGLALDTLAPALVTYAAVLIGALVLPGVAAQVLRRRDPIRGGALSTNWNWLGGLALVPLAGLATFALTAADGMSGTGRWTELLTVMAVAGAALAALRLLTTAFLRLRGPADGLGRDLFITQNTPNVFLWLAMTAVLAPASGARPSLIGLGVALVFFLAVAVDEGVFLYGHSRDLRAAQLTRPRPLVAHTARPVQPASRV